MDKSWMSKSRLSKEYENGVNYFLAFAKQNLDEQETMPCPCGDCGNLKKFTAKEVEAHLYFHGIQRNYTRWIWHGETAPSKDPPVVNRSDPIHSHFENETFNDFESTQRLIDAAGRQFADDPDKFRQNPEKFKKLLEDAEEPLYKGCSKFSKLSATVQLFNLKAKSGMADKYFSQLLGLIREMLPGDSNVLPRNVRDVKKILSVYGMKYEKIHACPNSCILYRKEYKYATICPTCKEPRYKVNKKTISGDNGVTEEGNGPIEQDTGGVPAKVMWYFPPIPRFKTMFQSVKSAKSLVWHANEREVDDKLRHPADSPAWKLVDDMWPEFGEEPRNIRLALSADGVNPFGSLSSRYSCWPIMMVTYNLPPWLYMKRKYVMLTMLISGPRQPGNNIDVYLAPLIDDLKTLWGIGVDCYDAYQQQTFTLRAVLLWTINDFPALGNLSGFCVKGYYACPICNEKTVSYWLKHSRKNVFADNRMFLPIIHRFRSQRKAFNGKQEFRAAPTPLTGEELFDKVKGIKTIWGKPITSSKKSKSSRNKDDNDDSSATSCWKKKSIFFELEYWKHLLVRHNLDVMHIEKNVCESIVGTLLDIPGKTKDGLKSRLDLKEMGIRDGLAPQLDKKKAYLPPAPYTLSKKERTIVCKTLHELKVPSGYSSNFKSLVSMQDAKLGSLKSHDCHILMQQLLPVAIRSVLPKHVRYVITRFCFFFKEICAKVIDVERMLDVQKDLVVTLCLLEKYFPPSFFDIMVHLTVHLVREVQLCGPVCFRWMYGFERNMSVLKSYVRNRNRPEGCMAECFVAEEAIEFCSEFLSELDAIGLPSNNNDTCKEIVYGKVPPGGQIKEVDPKSLEQAHSYVLHNTTDVEPYVTEHMKELKEKHHRQSKNETWLQHEHNRTFISWLKENVYVKKAIVNDDISKVLRWIAQGPRIHVLKYSSYTINGIQFNTKVRDASRVNQNSGVSIMATSPQVSSAKDKNPVFASSGYYGVIDEIWLLDYYVFKIPVFKCDWVDLRSGFQVDELGFTLVDLTKIGYKSESFILASQAKQVFYVADQLNPKWSIVLTTPERHYHDNENEVDVFDGGVEIRTNMGPLPHDDSFDEDQPSYVRDDCEGTWIDN